MESLSAVADETFKQGNQLLVHAIQLNQAKASLKLGAKILVHSVDDFEIDDEFSRWPNQTISYITQPLLPLRAI